MFVSLVIFQTASIGPDKIYEPEYPGYKIVSPLLQKEQFLSNSSRLHVSKSGFGFTPDHGILQSRHNSAKIHASQVIENDSAHFVIVRKLNRFSVIAGLFNHTSVPSEVSIDFNEIGLRGREPVRDLWNQKNIGRYKDRFTALVPAGGVVMVRIGR